MLHQDFSTPPAAQNRGRGFDELESVYLSLSEEFKRLNLQKAANHQYLESVVEHIGVALICLDEAGQVVMINEPARSLFETAARPLAAGPGPVRRAPARADRATAPRRS